MVQNILDNTVKELVKFLDVERDDTTWDSQKREIYALLQKRLIISRKSNDPINKASIDFLKETYDNCIAIIYDCFNTVNGNGFPIRARVIIYAILGYITYINKP